MRKTAKRKGWFSDLKVAEETEVQCVKIFLGWAEPVLFVFWGLSLFLLKRTFHHGLVWFLNVGFVVVC